MYHYLNTQYINTRNTQKIGVKKNNMVNVNNTNNTDTSKLTPFGVFVRKLRLDNDERLKDMAERMGVSSTYLSSIEYGRRAVPSAWRDKIQEIYHLETDEVNSLDEAIQMSRLLQSNKVDISHLSEDDKFMIGKIVENLPDFTEVKRKDLRNIIDD